MPHRSVLPINLASGFVKKSGIEANAQTITVSDIAKKWGFTHLGRFAKEYKALFGVLPSETLNLALGVCRT